MEEWHVDKFSSEKPGSEMIDGWQKKYARGDALPDRVS
jgi:hypothetical protein